MTDNFKIGDKVRIINRDPLWDDEKYYPHRKIGTEFIISDILERRGYNYNILDEQGRAHNPCDLQKILMATDTRTGARFEVHSYTDETVLEAMSNDGSALRGRPRAHVAIDGIDSPYVPVLALTNTIKDAAEFLHDIARVSNMSKANCEVADQHAQALYAIIATTPPAPANTGRLSTLDLKDGDVVERVTEHDRFTTKDIGQRYIARLKSSYWPDGLHFVKSTGAGWTSINDKGTFRIVSRASEWIEWNGGKCPVVPGTKLHYKLRRDPNASHKSDAPPEYLNWSHHHPDHAHYNFDIIAYRVVK